MITGAHTFIRTADPDDAAAMHALYSHGGPRSALLDARREPMAAYTLPLTISGVDSRLYSGVGPRFAPLKRQAIFRLLKLPALIWSSGEYFVLPVSAP